MVVKQKYDPNKVKVSEEPQNTRFCIVGEKTTVERLAVAIGGITKELEDRLSMQKKSIEEKITNLSLPQLRLLKVHGFVKTVNSKYKLMGVDLNPDEKLLIFKGLPGELTAAKVFMYEFIQDFQRDSIETSFDMIELLKRKVMKADLDSEILKKNIKVIWELQNKEVVVYALSRNDVAKAVTTVKKHIAVKKISVDEKARPFVGNSKWKEMEDDLNKKYSDKFAVAMNAEKSMVIISCKSDVMDSVVKQVHSFLRDNAISGKFFNVEYGKLRVVTQYMKKALEGISEKFVKHTVCSVILYNFNIICSYNSMNK